MAIEFRGRVFSVEAADIAFPDGRTRRVEVVRHSPSVILLPILADGQVMLIRQFRAALDRSLWEIPAGRVEEHETAEAAARRECEEEIGLVPRTVERLGSWFPTPGYCDEEMIFFRVSDLDSPPPGSPHKPDEDEQIEARPFSLADARAMVARGEIIDLKTAFALTLV
jgi:ADP-ribose pyrophosphatase